MPQSNLNELKKKVVPVLKEAGVTRSAFFGSYVRGQAEANSDVDILVEVPRGTGLFAFVALQHKLEDAVGKKVDLVTYRSLHPLIRDRILKEQIEIL